jgi:hypothetical protein
MKKRMKMVAMIVLRLSLFIFFRIFSILFLIVKYYVIMQEQNTTKRKRNKLCNHKLCELCLNIIYIYVFFFQREIFGFIVCSKGKLFSCHRNIFSSSFVLNQVIHPA